MINNIKTFIYVAECGSFSKAAEQLYLSANAVKKRINYIETQLKFSLFHRNTKGVQLTKAGCSFYKDACQLLHDYEAAVNRAEQIERADSNIMRIGLMEYYADEFLMARRFDVREQFCDLKYTFTFFPSSGKGIYAMLSAVGSELDVVLDVYEKSFVNESNICAEIIDDIPVCCAVQSTHSFVGKHKLTIKELNGETVVIPKKDLSSTWNLLSEKISKQCPSSKIIEIESYNPKVFCQFLDEKVVFLLTDDWEEIYPFLCFIPLEGNFHIPFAIYYSHQISEKVAVQVEKLALVSNNRIL